MPKIYRKKTATHYLSQSLILVEHLSTMLPSCLKSAGRNKTSALEFDTNLIKTHFSLFSGRIIISW